MAPNVEVSHLSKQYRLGRSTSRDDSLRATFTHALHKTWRTVRHGNGSGVAAAAPEWIWSLKDVSFNLQAGDAVGIIGANGAGKSTLLKILSRITDPTEGQVTLRGRVASLLEVGTGFHPDLTGRENIFLSGVMLGMTKAEVQAKFDEIVAFAELEQFLDTPVKRYSSGMYVRLGFAVAAHLDPEILIVDEVLAVGDMAFQRKCLGKMSEFGQGGHTVLFVSHNMAAIENLCQRGIVLRKGQLTFDGGAKDAITHYIHTVSGDGQGDLGFSLDLRQAPGRRSHLRPWFQHIEILTPDSKPFPGIAPVGASLEIYLDFMLERPTTEFDARINFMNLFGQVMFAARLSYEPDRQWGERSGRQRFVCEIPSLTLIPGEYRMDLALLVGGSVVDYIENALRLTTIESDYYGTGKVPNVGVFVLQHHWREA
jgi:lipopolysaccharide transport system ATP-binding protein